MRIKLLIFLSIVFLISCGKETIVINNSSESNSFDNLKVNQKLKFVLYIANTNDVNDFKYQKDTLIWEVKSINNNSILIDEYLSQGSNSLSGNNLISHADETFGLIINKLDNDYLVSSNDERKSSRILFNQNQFKLNKALSNSPIIKLDNWLPNASLESSEGSIVDASIHSKKYDQLNIIIDNTSLKISNIGSYFIYSPKGLILRTLQYNTFNHTAYGWDMLN